MSTADSSENNSVATNFSDAELSHKVNMSINEDAIVINASGNVFIIYLVIGNFYHHHGVRESLALTKKSLIKSEMGEF